MTEAVNPPPTVLPATPVPDSLPKPLNLEAELTKQQRKLSKDRAKGTLLNRSLELKNTVRMSFSLELNKLDTLETRETALRAVKVLLEGNRNREALKLFVTALATPKTQSAKGRCAELKVVQMLLRVFGDLLIEGAGAGLSRIYGVLLAYFSDRSREVQEAVANCLCVLYNCALPLGPSKSLQLLLEPLTLVLTSGTELSAQQTASVALRTWICSLPQDQTALIIDAAKRITGLFLKLRPGYPDLISTLGYLVQHFGMDFILPDLLQVVKKLLAYFGLTSQSGYFGAKEACKLLAQIVKRLNSAVACLGELKEEVIERLKEAKTHKVAEVQREAALAYSLWTGKPTFPPSRPVLTRLRTTRDALKRGKTAEASPPVEDQWGVYRPKYLTRGSGRYVPQLGYGRLDLSKAIQARPSLRDFFRKKGKSETGRIEIYAKSPTEASRIVPRRGYGEGPGEIDGLGEGDRGEEPAILLGEEQVIDTEGAKDQEDEEKVEENEEKIAENMDKSSENEAKTPENEENPSGNEEKASENEEEASSFQPFQVEAPVQSTETANPRLLSRFKGSEKKPEAEKPIESLPEAEIPSNKPDSGQSSSRLKKAVAKSSILRKLTANSGKIASKPTESPESQEVLEASPVVSPKSSSSALFGALGKSVLGRLNSIRTPKDLISPKESGQASPGTLTEELTSSAVDFPVKASNLTSVSVAKSEEMYETEGENEEMAGSLVEWMDKVVTQTVDRMEEQFLCMETALKGMEMRVGRLEGKTAYELHKCRARNAATPRYKSHIHPPQPPTPILAHTTTQTRATVRSHSTQTPPLPPSQQPSDPLTHSWSLTLSDLRNQHIQRAYRRVLRTGDDLYLIRLMVTTGVVLGELEEMTVGTVMTRVGQVLTQAYVAGVRLDWVAESVQTGLFFEMGPEEQQNTLKTIEVASTEDSEDGLKARNLYDYLTSN